ncbi:unnamed protein product [Nezara viridula]|uniref:Uncharacterized protein n=1 Tax=Nezara viridula TaxID=85310 RepID=A0A9P0MNB6_NEZVI|nr:unnamed protein product [Nezara viridula]
MSCAHSTLLLAADNSQLVEIYRSQLALSPFDTTHNQDNQLSPSLKLAIGPILDQNLDAWRRKNNKELLKETGQSISHDIKATRLRWAEYVAHFFFISRSLPLGLGFVKTPRHGPGRTPQCASGGRVRLEEKKRLMRPSSRRVAWNPVTISLMRSN